MSHLLLPGKSKLSTSQSGTAQQSADEVARKLANPNAAMGVLSFLTDFINYGGDLPGAGKENAFKISSQPSLLDQAALMGIPQNLNDCGIAILSMDCLGGELCEE